MADKRVKEVVNLWNTTQEYLPKVKVVDRSLQRLITSSYDEIGIDNIKTVFELVNKIALQQERKFTFDWVLTPKNAAKILNGDFQELKIEVTEKPIGLPVKQVYYRTMQELGRLETDQEFDERYKFTESEKKELEEQGRYIQGRYIAIPVEESEEQTGF